MIFCCEEPEKKYEPRIADTAAKLNTNRKIMNNTIRLAILGAFGFLTTASPAFAQRTEDGKLNSFFKSYLEQHFRQQPLEATSLGDRKSVV